MQKSPGENNVLSNVFPFVVDQGRVGDAPIEDHRPHVVFGFLALGPFGAPRPLANQSRPRVWHIPLLLVFGGVLLYRDVWVL